MRKCIKNLTEENLRKIRMIFLIFLCYNFTIYSYTTHVYFDWLKARVQTIGSGIYSKPAKWDLALEITAMDTIFYFKNFGLCIAVYLQSLKPASVSIHPPTQTPALCLGGPYFVFLSLITSLG